MAIGQQILHADDLLFRNKVRRFLTEAAY